MNREGYLLNVLGEQTTYSGRWVEGPFRCSFRSEDILMNMYKQNFGVVWLMFWIVNQYLIDNRKWILK